MSSYRVQFVAHLIQADYTEYHIKVTSTNGESWLIRRRYSEFRELHDHLRLKYGEQLPPIPGKRLWGNQDPAFVKERQDGLQRYMDGVLQLDPECRTKFLRRFLEIREAQGLLSAAVPAGSSKMSPIATSSAGGPPPLTSTWSAGSAASAEAKRRAIATCEERLFNLSTSVARIDAAEEAQRRKKYKELFSRLDESIKLPAYRPTSAGSRRGSGDGGAGSLMPSVIDLPLQELVLVVDM